MQEYYIIFKYNNILKAKNVQKSKSWDFFIIALQYLNLLPSSLRLSCSWCDDEILNFGM